MIGLLIDLRHPGLPIDMKAYEWLRSIAPSLQIIGTKGDKLKRNELVKNKNFWKNISLETSRPLPTLLSPERAGRNC